MNQEHSQKAPHSTLNIILIFFILISLLTAGFVFWKNIEAESLTNEYNSAIENQDRQIKKMLENNQIGAKAMAQNILIKAQKYRIEWSVIAQTILREIESEDIQIETINSGKNKYFTVSGSAKDLRSIARLIDKMKKNENFDEPFVSNLSQSETQILPFRFSLTFYYLEKN